MSAFAQTAQAVGRQEWATYRRLLGYAWPHRRRLFYGTLFGLLYGGAHAGMLGALQKVWTRVFDAGAQVPWPAVATGVVLLPLAAVVLGLGAYFSMYFISWVGNRVVMELREALFAHIHRLPMSFFTQSRTGELISRTTNDTMQIEKSVSGVVSDLVREPFVLVAAVGYLLWTDPLLAGLSLLLFPVCIVPVALFGRRVRRFARESQQKLADIVSVLQESILGVRIVKAFGMEPYEIGRFNERALAVFRRVLKVTRASAAVDPLVIIISFVGLSLTLVYVWWAGMTSGKFVSFAAALVMMYQPVKKISKLHLLVQQGAASADRIFELLDAPVTVADRPAAHAFSGPVEQVEFDRVTFAYDAEPVLREVNLRVRAGQCLALVGSSGSGKSTLVSLLPRFYDVTAGAIRLNGHDLRDLSLASLRAQIGIVTQETILFNDTVAANIAYGRREATRAQIEEAARRAHADGFIRELPEGYETMIGERGLRLSGGQCQRLAIARAILRNPPILILDEATSALDTESERAVQAALDELMGGRTVFAIAHRLSTIMHADQILVLDRGAVVEQGTHAELLARAGRYRELYELQFRA